MLDVLASLILTYASELDSNVKDKLYQKDRDKLTQTLDDLVNKRNASLRNNEIGTGIAIGVATAGIGGIIAWAVNFTAITGITITNNSKYKLEYCYSGSDKGYFFTGPPSDSFGGPNNTIEPNFTAGFVSTKSHLSSNPASGYITFRIRTDPDQTYLVIIAWEVNRAYRNRAGLEIRPSSGSLEPTGIALFPEILLHEHNGGKSTHIIKTEVIGKFKLIYNFDNDRIMKCGYHLVVENG